MSTLFLGIIAGLVVCQLANLLTTVWLHRALSHRAMTVAPWVSGVCRVLIWVTTGIRPRQWVAVHRKHHAFTDVEGDPHSPVLLGYPAVQFGNVGLYRRVAKDHLQVARYARDLPADRWDRALFDRALLGLAIGIAFLCAVIGWKAGLIAAGVHMVTYLALGGAVNGAAHQFGRRPFDNLATNLQWLAFLTMGEGLHNNHHAAPTSARLSHARGEIDPAWPVIRLIEKLRLAEILQG
jgi:stearoyl-CoA desaturase (Delta-9 desaturase)